MGAEQSNQVASNQGSKSSASKAERLRRGKSVPEQRWSGDVETPDQQRPGSASPGHSICSDSDLPYISYTVSRPIGDSPKPQHKYHLSRAKSSPQNATKAYGMSRQAASKVDPNLIVVKEPLPGETTETDPDILQLHRIPKFLPIMRGSIGAADAKDPEVFERLDANNLYRLCLIYENYLHRYAVSVESDQKILLDQIKEIYYESNRLFHIYTERQRVFARYADQLSKVTQLEQSLNKCHLNLNKTLETVEILNNSLPPDERLEPFVWTTENVSDPKQAEELFKKLFTQQRFKQVEAVKRIQTLASEKRQNLMIATAAESIFKVLKSSRSIVESSGYVPGLTSFPPNQETREALSNILENTALFGDLLLHFPEISHAVLKDSHEWKVLYEWSVRFSNQTELLDPNTSTLIDLVSQELHIIDRKPDYINPYYKKPTKKYMPSNYSESQAKKVKKKQKLPRGPRLSSSNVKYEL